MIKKNRRRGIKTVNKVKILVFLSILGNQFAEGVGSADSVIIPRGGTATGTFELLDGSETTFIPQLPNAYVGENLTEGFIIDVDQTGDLMLTFPQKKIARLVMEPMEEIDPSLPNTIQFANITDSTTGGTTTDLYDITDTREFIVQPSQISDEKEEYDKYHVDCNMTNAQLISAELLRDPTPEDEIEIRFDYPKTLGTAEVNLSRNKIIAAIDPDPRFSLEGAKIDIPAGLDVTAAFVCDSEILADGKIPLVVQANLGEEPIKLSGDWTRYRTPLFETAGTGTINVESDASLPQSDIIFGGKGAPATVDFKGSRVSTGDGTTLRLINGKFIGNPGVRGKLIIRGGSCIVFG